MVLEHRVESVHSVSCRVSELIECLPCLLLAESVIRKMCLKLQVRRRLYARIGHHILLGVLQRSLPAAGINITLYGDSKYIIFFAKFCLLESVNFRYRVSVGK